MRDELNLKVGDEEIEIKANRSDMAAALIRGIVGAAPFVGPMIAEGISAGIPNQKVDRIIIFVKALEDRVKYLEEDVLKEKFKSEEFTDLLEDGLLQASRALSNERREYIANLIKNGLTDDDLSHIEKKKLLSILGQLNDAEIIMLHFNSLEEGEERNQIMHKHHFFWVSVDSDLPQEEKDREALNESYRLQLNRLGLVKEENHSEQSTPLGDLLLRYIGLRETRPVNDSSA